MPEALVVDDDAKIRKYLRTVLEKEGFVVTEAANGTNAIAINRAQRPDIVLMDIVMPETDGITAIKAIREQNRTARILAISGDLVFTAQTYLDEARQAGANDTLIKPFDRREVVTVITRLLETGDKSPPPAGR